MNNFLKIMVSLFLGLVIVFTAKMLVSIIYECEPQEMVNPANFSFVVYDVNNGSLNALEEVFFEGYLVVESSRGDMFYFNLTTKDGKVVVSSVYMDGQYYFVSREGNLVESGVSPFFLHHPCFDPILKDLFELRYFDFRLDYDFIIYKKYYYNGSMKSANFGYAVNVYSSEYLIGDSPEQSYGFRVIIPYFDVNYVKGYGLGGTFLIPRDAILLDNLNYTAYIGGYSPALYQNGKPTPLGSLRGFDIPTIALVPIGVGLGLIIEGVRRVVGRRRESG